MRLIYVWMLLTGHIYWAVLCVYHSRFLRPLRRLLRPKDVPLEVGEALFPVLGQDEQSTQSARGVLWSAFGALHAV
jgi:hypothetical protein